MGTLLCVCVAIPGCHYADFVAVQNETSSELQIELSFSEIRFSVYDCFTRDICGEPSKEHTLTMAPGDLLCMIGPYGPSIYDAVEELSLLVVHREGNECLRGGSEPRFG